MKKERDKLFMARPGISYTDVEKIAHNLQGQGHIPTIERIRQLLGTGSSGTIATHLRTWKARQDETYRIASKEKLPEELVALLKGLWERVIDQADQKIEALKTSQTKTQQESQQQYVALEKNYQQLQRQHQQSEQTLKLTLQEKDGLAQAVLQYQKQQIALEADAKQFEVRLDEKQTQLNELQRLNQQIQQNLEHYRESVREQRLKEQQQYEQQIKQFEQTHRYLLQDNHDLKKSLATQQITSEQLSKDHQQLQQQYYQTKASLEAQTQQLQNLTNENESQKQQTVETKTQYDALVGKTNQQQELLVITQQQLELLKQKYSDKEKQCNNLSDQNKQLSHEKWILEQEKNQSFSQIKQLETMINEHQKCLL